MNPNVRAAFWMLGAVVSFSAMAVAGRELGQSFDTFEIMLYRSAFGLIIVLTVATVAGTLGSVGTDAIGQHFLRNLFHFSGQNLWFFAVTVIPLAQVFALEFTTPIWVIALSPLLLGERLTPMRLIAAILGFIGVLIVVRPGTSPIGLGVLAAASSAIFFALTYVATKRLTRTQSITSILFYLTVIQLVFGLICAGIDGNITLPDLASLPTLMLVGICGLLAHFCITSALNLAPAAVVAPVDFIRLPVIAIIGMLVYQEALDIWVFAGALLIFAGNYLNIWDETRR